MSANQQPDSDGQFPIVRSEEDVLRLALAVAAQKGDPDPELIQHTIGTRQAATQTTGSWVRSEEPSYLIAMRGKFSAPNPQRSFVPSGRADTGRHADTVSYSVQVLVVSIETGRITDSGGGADFPNLASVGPVVTDRMSST